MPRDEDSEHGAIYERTFSGVLVDETQQSVLETFKDRTFCDRRLLLDYRLDEGGLTLRRPWIEGETIAEHFGNGKSSATDLAALTLEIYCTALGELYALHDWGYAHGAIHPRNLIIPADRSGILLLDPVFNSAGMTGSSGWDGGENLWSWGPCLPVEWTPEDRDWISLLRLAALLATPNPGSVVGDADAVLESCREWVKVAMKSSLPGSLPRRCLEHGETLLKRIATATYPVQSESDLPSTAPGTYPVEEDLSGGMASQGENRMLRREEEDLLRQRARTAGLVEDEIVERIEVWLVLQRKRRQSEVEAMAGEFLRAGHDRRTGMIRRRACIAAERTFTSLGVDTDEARRRVTELIQGRQGLDERVLRDLCRRRYDTFLSSSEAGSAPCAVDTEGLVGHLRDQDGLSREIAQRLVAVEHERRLFDIQ